LFRPRLRVSHGGLRYANLLRATIGYLPHDLQANVP
jgi:hypothetical protein